MRRVKPRHLVTMIVVVGTVVGSSLLARRISSPEERAARSAPPEPSLVTAAVEDRVLSESLVVRGDVVASNGIAFGWAAVPGVVTAVHAKVGDQLVAGSVLLEVNERPVIVLKGAIPTFRELKPGISGGDVEQLQTALKAQGHAISDEPGYFGADTSRAVSEWYHSLGYKPLEAVEDGYAKIIAGERAVRAKRAALAAAQTARTKLGRRAKPAMIAAADQAVVDANVDVSLEADRLQALMSQFGPAVPAAELLFTPSLPVRITSITGRVGSAAKETKIAASGGHPEVQSTLTNSASELVTVGAAVTLFDEVSGTTYGGVVSAVSRSLKDDSLAGVGLSATIDGTPPLTVGLVGRNLRVTVQGAHTAQAARVVPVAALFDRSDGHTYVTVVATDATIHDIEVGTGASIGGYVVLTEVTGHPLPAAGTRVLLQEAPALMSKPDVVEAATP